MADIEKVNTEQPMRETLKDAVRAIDELIDQPSGGAVNNIAPLTVDTPPEAVDNESVAIGNGAVANSYSIAIGDEAFAREYETIAIGRRANVSGEYSIGIGKNVKADGDSCVSIGISSSSGLQSVSIGVNSCSNLNNGVAIGSNASCKADYGIAIGAKSECNDRNTLSIGRNDLTRRIAYVTDPTNKTDAATKNYVDTQVATIESTLAQSISDNMDAVAGEAPDWDSLFTSINGVTMEVTNGKRFGDILSFDLNITVDANNSVTQNVYFASVADWITGKTFATSYKGSVFELSESGIRCNTALTSSTNVDLHFVTTYKEVQ